MEVTDGGKLQNNFTHNELFKSDYSSHVLNITTAVKSSECTVL